MKNVILPLLLLCLCFSCQTEIEVKIPTYYNKLVVEGYIENGEYPMVSLYRSAPYFSTMSMKYLMDSVIIRDAQVFIITEQGEMHKLSEILSPQAPLFYAYSTRAFKGELNHSYKLRIEWNDKVYTSETKILDTFELDSVAFVPTFGRTEIDSIANIRIWMTDNGQSGNYYQFKVKIHCKDKGFPDRLWITTIPAAFDNSPFFGQSFNYEIIRGAPSAIFMPNMTDKEMRRYLRGNYRRGDTVYMRYSRLDYASFNFWSSISGELTFGQNPFMSPTPVLSNILCNTGEKCLGVWCGSASKEIVMILDSATSKTARAPFGFR